MMLRTFTLLLTLLSITHFAKAQKTTTQTNTLYPGVTEKYSVLTINDQIKQGLYQALYHKKTVLASGLYNNGKRSGIWHFYNPQGTLVEHFNYDEMRLTYEAKADSTTWIEYNISQDSTAKLTRPIKIGGNFFGYLPYIKQFKLAQEYNPYYVYGVLQIIVSPAGRLAECKLLIKTKLNQNTIDSYLINPETLNEDDKVFLPATENGTNVVSTIYIYCAVQSDFTISMYDVRNKKRTGNLF